MNNYDAAKMAAELVKAALGAGWLDSETNGEAFGAKVGDAIEAIAKRLVQIT